MAVSSGTLLKPATVEMLQTPQRLASGEETDYGLGWKLETVALAGTTRADGGPWHQARFHRWHDVPHDVSGTRRSSWP